jgi:hypothetical protein
MTFMTGIAISPRPSKPILDAVPHIKKLARTRERVMHQAIVVMVPTARLP